MSAVPTGFPGVQPTTYTTTPRDIFWGQPQMVMYLPVPAIVDGANSFNALNNPYNWLMWAGMPLGQITSSGNFTPSILGLSLQPLGGAQTTLYTDVNTAQVIVNRPNNGTSGTLTLTGPPVPSGVVRSRTVTYSNVNTSTGAITITPLFSAGVSGVNQINDLPFVDSTGSGTFTLTIEGITTGAITYSSTAATLYANINTALNATFGTSAIVASGASLAAIVLTFSGTGYTYRPVGTVQATIQQGSTGYTINGSGTVGTPSTSAVGTAGVSVVAGDSGEFIAGSLIQPNDGSQTMKTLIVNKNGTKVIDQLNTTRVSVEEGQLWAGGGVINSAYIVNYPTDPSLQQWVKGQLRAFVNWAVFSDDYVGL